MKKISLFLFFLSILVGYSLHAQVQNALQFDGVNDYVSIPDHSSLDITTAITIEAWINLSAWDQGGCIVTKGVGSGGEVYSLDIHNNKARFYFWKGATAYQVASASNITANVWNHVVGMYNGSNPIVILNGVKTTGAAFAGTLDQNNHIVTIGTRETATPGDYSLSVTGKIDEVRIWNVARTDAQIQMNMYRQLINPSSEANLVAYYQFNEISGTTSVPDESNNTNIGTLTNMNPNTDWVSSTAPIPYYTITNGNWNTNATWATGQLAPSNAWARSFVVHSVNITANTTTEEVTINAGGLTIDAGKYLTVNGTLTNNVGNSGLVVKSDGTGTGSLINGSTVNGTIERYYTGQVWHFISPPVSGAVSGIFETFYLQYLDEPSNTYLEIIPTNVPLNVMQGYALWHIDAGGQTTSYTGPINTGAQSMGVTANNLGWNLVGNPYPSSIDWDAASGWTKTNINNATYIENNGGWATYIAGVGLNGGTRYIAPGQGFIVQCSANPGTLGMNNSVRVHNATTFFKDQVSNLIRLEASGNGYTDETVVRFLSEATPDFDGMFDAVKFFAGNTSMPQIYSFDHLLAINSLPETQTVNIGFRAGQAGKYAISLTELNDIGWMSLEDTKTGEIINLQSGPYRFTYETTDPDNRFVLHLAPLGVPENNDQPAKVFASGSTININLNTAKGEVSVFNLLGQEIASQSLALGMNQVAVTNKGTYIVRVIADGKTVTNKVVIQ